MRITHTYIGSPLPDAAGVIGMCDHMSTVSNRGVTTLATLVVYILLCTPGISSHSFVLMLPRAVSRGRSNYTIPLANASYGVKLTAFSIAAPHVLSFEWQSRTCVCRVDGYDCLVYVSIHGMEWRVRFALLMTLHVCLQCALRQIFKQYHDTVILARSAGGSRQKLIAPMTLLAVAPTPGAAAPTQLVAVASTSAVASAPTDASSAPTAA